MSDDPEIRFLGDLQRLEVRPGDRFVLTLDRHHPNDVLDRARAYVAESLGVEPGRVLVLQEGMTLGVIGDAPAYADEISRVARMALVEGLSAYDKRLPGRMTQIQRNGR